MIQTQKIIGNQLRFKASMSVAKGPTNLKASQVYAKKMISLYPIFPFKMHNKDNGKHKILNVFRGTAKRGGLAEKIFSYTLCMVLTDLSNDWK